MMDTPMSAAELASAIERMTGLDPSAYAAERIGAQSCTGDQASVRRLAEIARLGDPSGRDPGDPA